jgi:hypothetical protein
MKNQYITTSEKTNKNGKKYYTQVITDNEMDNDCNFIETIVWSGRVAKAVWNEVLQSTRIVSDATYSNERVIIVDNF